MADPNNRLLGPFRFADHAGKLIKRGRFLDGTYKVYWAPGVHTAFEGVLGIYNNPSEWGPQANDPLLMPRVIRCNCHTTPTDINTAFKSLAASMEAEFKNLWFDDKAAYPFFTNGDSLRFCTPVFTDLLANNYFATDSLHFLFASSTSFLYTGIMGPSAAQVARQNLDASRVQQTGEQSPRYHLRVYLYDDHAALPAPIQPTLAPLRANNITVYSSTFPGMIDPEFYSYGGIVSPGSTGNGAYRTFIIDHFGLE